MHRLLAQQVNVGNMRVKGPLDPSIKDIGSLVSIVLKFGIPLAFLVLLFVFISAGYDLLTSQGDPAKIKTAKSKITYGIIGIILLLSAFFIAALVGTIFGFGKGIFYQ